MTKERYSHRAKLTRKRHKKANRNRGATFELAVAQLTGNETVDEIVANLHQDGHYGGLGESDQPNLLFTADGTLGPVPLGILSHKEEPLPPHLLPRGQSELLAFCKRLICVPPDEHLVALIGSGWPGGRAVDLKIHAADLWHVRNSDFELYRYLVCGQHYSARRRALGGGCPHDWSQERFDDVLARMALLWCAHDVQLTFVRGARLELNPFGTVAAPSLPTGRRAFLDSNHRVISPATVVEAARTNYVLAKRVLAMRDQRDKEQRKFLEAERKKTRRFQRLCGEAKRVYAGGANPALPLIVRQKVDEAQTSMAAKEQDNPFWQHLANHINAPPLPRTFAQLCLTGLTVLTSNAGSILRYCQAEREIGELIAQTDDGVGGCRPLGDFMNGFSRDALGPGGMKRARNLLRGYRARYPDKDFGSVSKISSEPSYPGETQQLPGIGQTALDAAAEFLERCGARRPGDQEGPIDSERRTFYLLDVIPDARLCR